MNVENYLDFETLFINEIAGDLTIFLFLSFVMIMYLCAKFRFPNIISIAIFIVYSILISVAYPLLLVIPILMIGIVFTWFLNKISK